MPELQVKGLITVSGLERWVDDPENEDFRIVAYLLNANGSICDQVTG
jgi:hypothetical protein